MLREINYVENVSGSEEAEITDATDENWPIQFSPKRNKQRFLSSRR